MRKVTLRLLLFFHQKLCERDLPETLERKMLKAFVINVVKMIKNQLFI